MQDIHEPHKTRHAISAALMVAAFFGIVLLSNLISWGAPPPPAAMRISLIPDIPVPPPPPPPEPEPAPEPEKPAPQDTAAEAERQAEIIRAEKEKKRKQEEAARKKREAEKKRKEEAARKKREEEKKRKEDEARKKREAEKKRKEEEARRKREQEEQRARLRAEAAAAEAERQRQQALEKRTARIANDYAARIIASIDQHLKTPAGVPEDSDIVVIVRVQLNPDGSLIGIPEVEESSGYSEYDEAAIRAVLKAAPLPVPTESFITGNSRLMQQFLEHRLYIRPR